MCQKDYVVFPVFQIEWRSLLMILLRHITLNWDCDNHKAWKILMDFCQYFTFGTIMFGLHIFWSSFFLPSIATFDQVLTLTPVTHPPDFGTLCYRTRRSSYLKPALDVPMLKIQWKGVKYLLIKPLIELVL